MYMGRNYCLSLQESLVLPLLGEFLDAELSYPLAIKMQRAGMAISVEIVRPC